MILIPHYVASSTIAGAGLFAAVDIQPGEKIYQLEDRFLLVISEAEIKAMPAAARAATAKYSYRGKGADRLQGAVYYCADDSRFMNHSDDPNTRSVRNGEVYVAARFIAANTEITCDYGEFCDPADLCFDFG